MALEDIFTKSKEKFYDKILDASMAFSYSNDLMHVGLIGVIPFLKGKYAAELLGNKFPFFSEHSTVIGFAAAGLAELLWQRFIEPSSPYDHAYDKFSDYKGILETALGASLAYFGTRLIK
nr:hypothetical protein [Candidatus Woesearchaeota archaeon]